MAKRTYEFGEPIPQGNTTSANSVPVHLGPMVVTTHKPNPFHGIDRWIFAFDEFNHRHGLNNWGPLRWLCNWWDRRICGE